ncbi:MAG: hypothetical protein K0Q73_7640 [Paenibacillus sp.]|nr:hypothetical protein [Paenibacillus sp.]
MRVMRFCTLIVLFAILGSLVAACNRDGQDNAVKTVDPNEQPIELVFYGGQSNWTDEMFWALYGNLIKKKFPNITPKFIPNTKTPLKNLVTTGETVDLMLVTTSGAKDNILDYNFQTDISDLIKESKYQCSAGYGQGRHLCPASVCPDSDPVL